jgi:hypothetical protein
MFNTHTTVVGARMLMVVVGVLGTTLMAEAQEFRNGRGPDKPPKYPDSSISASAEIDAVIELIQPVSVSRGDDLDFGLLARPLNGAVVQASIDPVSGQFTFDGNGSTQLGQASRGTMTVSGEPGYQFQLAVVQSASSGNGVSFQAVETAPSEGSVTLPSSGAITLGVGGTVAVGSGQSGRFTLGTVVVTVQY